MNSFNPSVAPLFFLLVFLKFSHAIGNDNVVCPKIEEQMLLNFKQSLKNFSSLSSSWIGEVNCCRWDGVICNNLTGHVEELRLGSFDLSGKLSYSLLNLTHLRYLNLNSNDFKGTIPSFIGSFSSLEHLDLSDVGFHGKLKSSLLNLTHLRHLDLSFNDFKGTIPSFIGSFSSLEHLDLFDAGFHGTIPYTIGNLSNLHTLNLGLYHSQQHRVDNLEWLLGLSRLEHLNMQSVDLSSATDWVQVINKLPSLAKLSFSYCSLNFAAPLNGANISTSLTFLDLFGNPSEPLVVPSWIFQISSLILLDLVDNNFRGPIPSTSNTTNLRRLDFSYNNFSSTIPDWLYSCKFCECLDLSFSKFSGKIPREIGYLSKLKELDLSYNNLQGEIPDSIENMSNLQILELSTNQLSGAIPTNLGKLLSLVKIDVKNNMLTGNLPESLGQLFHLKYFCIMDNKLEGVVTEKHFANLTKLEFLYASRNNLTLTVNPNWVPPFKLEILKVGSWNLGATRIPSWIDTQKYSIKELDLSYTGISGTIPKWLWRVGCLDLSHNHLSGNIPNKILDAPLSYLILNRSFTLEDATVNMLDLSDNSFSGDISHFLCDLKDATYAYMNILRLGGNQLSGELRDCWTGWGSLRELHLENNNISGSIPNSLGILRNLESLDLHGNNISGQIPLSILNCTRLRKIDLSHNELDGNIPTGMGTSLSYLWILVLRSNKLSGKISSHICHLNNLKILDLSSNNFFGVIPWCVDNFTAMAIKGNFDPRRTQYYDSPYARAFIESANVSTKGRALQYNVTLPLVTNIDLSENNFSGDIPVEFTSLVELRSLNLSRNHLTGSIPRSIGDMKQLESLDLSRNSLSGGIPDSFTIMSSLSCLNLSYNNLTGGIPESSQLCSLDASSFMGNSLHGPPLTSNCSYDHDRVPGPTIKDDSVGENSKIEWLYVFLSLGYAVGFSAVCVALVLKKTWRDAYFGFLGEVGNKIYVFFCVKGRRLMRAWHPSP